MKRKTKINIEERPENYRLEFLWVDSTQKGEGVNQIEAEPATILSVWRSLNFINEHNRSIGQGVPYTDIEAEFATNTGSGPVTFEQTEALAKIMDIQSQREENYLDNQTAGAIASENRLRKEQELLFKLYFNAKWG